MSRDLKTLGLALVAIFALCAVVAGAASADEFKAEKTPVTITGAYDGGSVDEFGTTSGFVACKKGSSVGTIGGGGSPTTAITMTPVYSDCLTMGMIATAVDMNGCDYKFTINVGASTAGTMHIICPKVDNVTQEIQITEGVPGTLRCTIDIPEQTLTTGITYKNLGFKEMREITVEILSAGMEYKETAGTGLLGCKNSLVQKNGILEGKEVFSGEEDPGAGRIGIYVE